MNTWDRLAAEGFGPHEAAPIMGCNPRTAAKELNLAHDRQTRSQQADLDAVSRVLSNPAYGSLKGYGTKATIMHGKTRLRPVREFRIPQSAA